MMPYRKWFPPDEWFDSPEWVVADAFLALRVDGFEMAPLNDQENANEDGHLALLALRNAVESDDLAIIGGKLYKIDVGEMEEVNGEWFVHVSGFSGIEAGGSRGIG